jgi:hypothetical protein
VADDKDHRLETTKLAKIMEVAGAVLKSDDLPVEVECEEGTVSQYPVAGVEVTPAGLLFYLGTKHTACLAPEKCGVKNSRVNSRTENWSRHHDKQGHGFRPPVHHLGPEKF